MKRPQDGAIITQFDYPTCETLGLLKMDFLGLRNLTVVSDALENIALNGKPDPDLDHLTSTIRRPTSCWDAARPSACSSSMAAACATSSSS